ncbi:MAG TPA: Ku protein, partial [Gemmataceae bacterium]|nr:Ku protein [Gemmataceae bacterium]
MAARSTWKGYLKLSLVSIPVKAYSTNSSEGSPIRLNQLHAECKSRIKNVKTCPIHGEVKNDQIVSGYEYSKDQYVLIDLDELSKLRSEDQKAITIREFIAPEALDPIYWNGSTLYLMPDGPIGQRPYALLHAGMVETNRYAIAQVVWHGKEHVVLIRPMGKLLAMCLLSYAHEISQPSILEPELVPTEQVPEEAKLVRLLIDAVSPREFDFAKYKDIYAAKLTELIETKVAGKEIVAAPAQEHTQVINLMDALKQSIAKLHGPAAAPTETAPAEETPTAPTPASTVSPPIMAPSKKTRA